MVYLLLFYKPSIRFIWVHVFADLWSLVDVSFIRSVSFVLHFPECTFLGLVGEADYPPMVILICLFTVITTKSIFRSISSTQNTKTSNNRSKLDASQWSRLHYPHHWKHVNIVSRSVIQVYAFSYLWWIIISWRQSLWVYSYLLFLFHSFSYSRSHQGLFCLHRYIFIFPSCIQK